MSDLAPRPLLHVEEWSVGFPGRTGYSRAVDHVSFDVAAGETLGIVGESGSGKSVTVMSLFGLIKSPPAAISGSAWLDGNELRAMPEPLRQSVRGADVGFVYQDPATALNPVIRVGDQIEEALRAHDKSGSRATRRSRSLELLAMVGIEPPERRHRQFPFELSGGMRQRVVIAMALANRPGLLIADEPTTALDVTIQSQIMELLRDAKEATGAAAILISHDLGLVGENADRIAVMYAGRIVETGTSTELLSRPRHPYTVGLLNCIPSIRNPSDRLPSIAGHTPDRFAPLVGCSFRPRCEVGRDRIECRDETPELTPDTTGREVACHFPDEADTVAIQPKRQIAHRAPEQPNVSPADTADPLLRVEGLTVQFSIKRPEGGKSILTAVDDVSLTVGAGESLGLVGESGCGKTTLARAIIRLYRPAAGRIIFDGADITTLGRRALRPHRRNVQMVFQDPFSSLNPKLTVADLIDEPMRVHRFDRSHRSSRIEELLETVGLHTSDGSRNPRDFSGGQRQRIAIARALALKPKLLVLDEAVSALDVSIQAQILNLLKDLQVDLGLSYIFVSHDLGAVAQVCDRVAVMYMGKLVEDGPRHTILSHPEHPYTSALLAAVPALPGETTERAVLGGAPPNPLDPPSGCRFRTRCPHAQERCAMAVPPLTVAPGGGHVACHFPLSQVPGSQVPGSQVPLSLLQSSSTPSRGQQ